VLETLLSRVWSTSPVARTTPSRNGSSGGSIERVPAEGFPADSVSPRVWSRSVSAARLIPNIVEDQKWIWLLPKVLVTRSQAKWVLMFLLILGGLFVVDPHDPEYFRHNHLFHEFNAVVSGRNAADAMWFITLSILGLSLVRRDSYMRHTVFFALEAVAGSEILTQVLKGIDRRVRPQDMLGYHHFADSWFRDSGHWYSGAGSFPSGHMIAAMSLATIFALRYSGQRWVPWTAYGLAVIIGFSRVTLLSHFPSDVFAGGVFGYVISRYVVLREGDSGPAPSADNEKGREMPPVEALR
jgi:membrane-associated phospholipid phosphatase